MRLLESGRPDANAVVTSLNLGENLDEACPEAVFLVDRLLRYVTGSRFTPSVEVDSSWLGRLLR